MFRPLSTVLQCLIVPRIRAEKAFMARWALVGLYFSATKKMELGLHLFRQLYM
jgi:hypothetical protein